MWKPTHWKKSGCWQKETGMAEDEMVGWHHRLSGHKSKQTSGDSEGQGKLTCCHPWGSQRAGHDLAIEQQNNSVTLWKNVYLSLLPNFGLGCLFFCYWVIWAACIFWKFIPCRLYGLPIFSPIFFHFCYGFFCCAKAYKLIRSYFFIFAFISIVLGDWPKKTLLGFLSENVLPMFFSGSSIVSYLIFKF